MIRCLASVKGGSFIVTLANWRAQKNGRLDSGARSAEVMQEAAIALGKVCSQFDASIASRLADAKRSTFSHELIHHPEVGRSSQGFHGSSVFIQAGFRRACP